MLSYRYYYGMNLLTLLNFNDMNRAMTKILTHTHMIIMRGV